MENVKLPVAWFYKRQNGAGHLSFKDEEAQSPYEKIPLYTHTEWQGLSDDEVREIRERYTGDAWIEGFWKFYHDVEQALKEKNNGN